MKLRYALSWRLPGGGRRANEELADAVLRELSEEIGMTSHGSIRPAHPDLPELLVVEDVRYKRPKWSWEIEAIREADLNLLPADLSRRAASWIEKARRKL